MKKKISPSPENDAEQAPAAGPAQDEAPPEPVPETPEDQLAAATRKLAEAQDRHLRLAADFDNYRKRIVRDLQEARTAARADVLLAVLNVFDHFRLAMEAAQNDANPEVLRSGMQMILAEFEKAFEEAGVSVVDAEGEVFDPQQHEAVAREPSATVPENHVLRQWRCGYRLGQRLLRPAAVVVSAGPPPADQAADASPQKAGGNPPGE